MEYPAEQRSPIPDLDTLDSTTRERNSFSSSETSGKFCGYYYAFIQNVTLFPVNFSSPKKRGQTTLNSERLLEVSTTITKDEHQLQGIISVSQGGHLGGTTEYTSAWKFQLLNLFQPWYQGRKLVSRLPNPVQRLERQSRSQLSRSLNTIFRTNHCPLAIPPPMKTPCHTNHRHWELPVDNHTVSQTHFH